MTADKTPPAEACIAVLGAGAWGTALAVLLARNGARVRLWGRDTEHIADLRRQRSNRRYLPDVAFPETLSPCPTLEEACTDVSDVLVAVPSAGFRQTLALAAPLLPPRCGLAWATKGLEPGRGRLLHEVAGEVCEARPLAVISGPTFAREVAARLPTAVTVAATTPDFARRWAELLHNDRFRAYTSTDLVGVEVGGAVKNVLAIAAGIADGLGFGANTRAALITRGLAEMSRLGVALDGRPETFTGLAGLGDLVLTCTDDQSRNRRLGMALARRHNVQAALEAIGQVVEGVETAREVTALARRLDIEMPIAEQVCQVLHAGRAPQEAVNALLGRALRPETPF